MTPHLPDEVVTHIVGQSQSASLVALTLVSHQFHRVAVQALYRDINFSDRFGNRESTTSKEIARLSVFLRTLKSSPSLRSHVRVVRLNYQMANRLELAGRAIVGLEDVVLQLLTLLATMPSLRNLLLAPSRFKSSLMGTGAPVTSLGLDYRYFDPEFYEAVGSYRKLIPTINLHPIFILPSLRTISIENIRSRDGLSSQLRPSSLAKSSPVTHFIFSNTVPPGADFEELLTWPLALESLRLSIWPEETGHDPEIQVLSPQRLVRALLPQRDSLTELLVAETIDDRGFSDRTIFGEHLRKLRSLRRLGVPLDFLVLPREPGVNVAEEAHLDLGEVLPEKLEIVQLELTPGIDYCAVIEGSGTVVLTAGDELIEWLENLILHKTDRYPDLRKVVLWRTYAWSEEEDASLLVDFNSMLISSDFLQLRDMFSNHGVQLLWGTRTVLEDNLDLAFNISR